MLKKIIYIFSLIVFTNGLSYLLTINELNPFFYLIGFRFYVFVIPIVIIIYLERKNLGDLFKEEFLNKNFIKKYIIVLWTFSPIILILTVGFLFKLIELNDPEYFYELGLSSIIDYPIYLIWNLPQILILSFFFRIISNKNLSTIIIVLITSIFLFSSEVINFNNLQFNYEVLYSVVSASIIFALLTVYIKNIYLSSISFFTVIWFYILNFGSNNQKIVKIFLAKQYEQWDGHFTVALNYSKYLEFVYFAVAFILILIILPLYRKNI